MGRWVVASIFAGVLIACSSFGGTESADGPGASTGDDGGSSGDSGNPSVTGGPEDFDLSFAPLNDAQTIIQGKDTTVPITLTRGKSLTGPATVTIEDFSGGLVAAPLTIVGNTGSLVLSSPKTGVQGSASGTIKASIGTHFARTALKTFVRGAPGALDTTWGNGGHVIAYTEAKGNGTADLVLGPNDDFYSLSGFAGGNGTVDDHVVHLDKDGVIDTAYGTNGVASVASFGPTAAALGADGRFIFVGNGQPPVGVGPPGTAMDFVGLSPDGKTIEFNVTTSAPPGGLDNRAAGAYALAIRQTDGHVFMGFDNASTTTVDTYCGVTHVDASGSPVMQFAGNGSLRNTVSFPMGIRLQAGGALTVVSVGAGVVYFVRYNAGNGVPLTNPPKTVAIAGVRRSYRGAAGLAAMSDDSIIAPFNGTAGLYLVKLDVNGDPVSTFGSAGIGGPYVIGGAATAMGIAVDANGKILVALDTGGIVRFTPTGALDSDFGVGGFAPTETSASLHRRVVVQKNGGRILASGQGASQQEVVISAYWP